MKETQTEKILRCIAEKIQDLDMIVEKTGFPRPTIRGRIHLLKKLGFVEGDSKKLIITELGKKRIESWDNYFKTGGKITGKQLMEFMGKMKISEIGKKK